MASWTGKLTFEAKDLDKLNTVKCYKDLNQTMKLFSFCRNGFNFNYEIPAIRSFGWNKVI